MKQVLRVILLVAIAAVLCAAASAEKTTFKSQTKGLLVISPKSFFPALTDYVAHKKLQRPVELMSLDAALKQSSGVDDPEKLKRMIYKAWKERNIGYVLLVGDADVMPVRYMVLDRVTPAAFNYAFYPSDLYYSDLVKKDGTFDDWNGQKEDYHALYFGEIHGEKHKDPPINFDNIDYHPDVAVGRWPVSDAREVRVISTKTISYENTAAASKAAEIRKTALLSVGGWVDSRNMMDRIANSVAKGWTAEKLYYTDDRRNDNTLPPKPDNVVALLNSGAGFVLHAGHGSPSSWADCLSTRYLPKITNNNCLPVMASAGCSTATFATMAPYEGYIDIYGKEHTGTDKKEVFNAPPPPPAPYQTGKYNPHGFGEVLLRKGMNGAVAYFGCNTGAQPCGLTLLEGLATAISASKEPILGDCWMSAINYYYDKQNLETLIPNSDWYPPSIYYQGMKFMFFGDPSLKMPKPL